MSRISWINEKRRRSGFSLVDILVAVVIAAVGVMGVLNLTTILTAQQTSSEVRADADYFVTSWSNAFQKDPKVKQAILGSGNLDNAVRDVTRKTFAAAGWNIDDKVNAPEWSVNGTSYRFSSFGKTIVIKLTITGFDVKIAMDVELSGGPGKEPEKSSYIWGLAFASGRTLDGDGPWESL